MARMQLSLLLLIALTLITLAACASRAEEQLQQQQQRRLRHRASIAHLRRGKHSEQKELDDEEEDEDEEEAHDYAEYVDASEAAATGAAAAAADHSLTASSAPPDIFTCCNQVFGSCRTACENLSLVQLEGSSSREEPRTELRKFCQLHQVEFWSCINRTLEAVHRGKSWSGRRCCQAAVRPQCRNACATAGASGEVRDVCRRSDEQVLYDCFEHQEAADSCCGQAVTSECLQACREVFEPPNETGTSNSEGNTVDAACGERNADVLQCISNHTDMTPPVDIEKYLPCCEYSQEEICRHTCKHVLQSAKTHKQHTERSDIIFARLEAGCGQPLTIGNAFWQCFLTVTTGGQAQRRLELAAQQGAGGGGQSGELNSKLGIDAAKRQCCEKANSHKCRRLCAQIFGNDWASRVSFETECLEQPAEVELKRCIESVDAPCELGCNGLSFCSNFNNRPTQLFRSCSAAHDAAAREDLVMLQQRGFVRVLGQELYIKNTTHCAPDKWQALVCALQIQPCTRVGLYNGICAADCTELLDECLDWTRQPQRPQAICERLQPATLREEDEPTPCISLRDYLDKPGENGQTELGDPSELTSPCAHKPCNGSEVCVLQRNGSRGYACIPGCSLGQASSFIVPFGAFVRVGKTSLDRGSGLAGGQLLSAEHVVCRCGLRGNIEQCQPLPSYTHAHCVLPGGRSFRHGTTFYLECNLCSCFAGEITCTKQQCRLPGFVDVSYTSLPCNCAAHYVPVCGSNGNTFPSACVAKCLGLREANYVYGACNARNACQVGAHDCPTGTQCLEKRQICLSSMQRPCPQYICVNITSPTCGTHQTEQLCDTQGRNHPNPCSLLQNNSQLAYWGACRPHPNGGSESGPVCGINGVTYRSSLAAWADYVHVDYVGRCREVGLLASDMGRRCRTVQCPKPISQLCRLIVPPGACCPICGGAAFRVIYSRKQLDRSFYALRDQRSSLLTLHGVLKEIDGLVQISECQLTGFLTMEVGIFVALVPRDHPTALQLKACGEEAVKISSLISSQSPRITTNLALSSLTVSHMIEPTQSGTASASIRGIAVMLLVGLLAMAPLQLGGHIFT